MKIGWGTGEVVVVLVSAIAYLFNLTYGWYALSLLLLLSGLWLILAGLFIVERKDRPYYGSWGVVVAVASAFAFLPEGYALGLVLVAIVALIILTAYKGKSGRLFTAATASAPATAGETPAAT